MNEKVAFEEYKKALEESGLVVTKTHVCLPPSDTNEYLHAEPALKLRECFNDGASVEEVRNSLESFSAHQIQKEIVASLIDDTKDNLVFRFIGDNERNDILTRSLLDMQYTPVKRVKQEDSFCSLIVTEGLARQWKMSADEIFSMAQLRQDWVCIPMMDVLKESADVAKQIHKLQDDPELQENFDLPMYVVTNRERIHGAAVLLDTRYLKNLHDQFGDYYVLPSSVHEIIVIPANYFGANWTNITQLRDMVQQVNREVVKEGEFLSDNVYCYTGDGLKIA